MGGFCSAAATKGWAWCNHNVMQSWRTYCRSRELKLLAGSGGFEFQEGMAGMDSLDKHVLTFCEHGQLKGRQPHCQPTEAKSWISTILHCLSAVAYIRQPRSQSIACSPNLGYHNSIFCKHDATDATIMQSWWSVLQISGTSSFW